MIPVNLKLSNFTSYGENPPELDFRKFHMAAISGQNGAGKSSLLDAITWCLWGSSRAGESSDALVHAGSNEMFVEFSFELDGHIFIVKRRRSKKSGGHTALELWSNSHNLTEGTIKATQQKIIDTLHLTFETFSNSSFLRQGHADEFTTKGPTDRKRILADILGLDHYDKLEEKAKEKIKDLQTKLSLIDYQLLEVEAEISQKEIREKNLAQIKEDEQKTKKELELVEQLVKSTEAEKQSTESNLRLLEQQKERYLELKKELDELNLQIKSKQISLEEFQQILNQKKEIEEDFAKLQILQEDKKLLESKRSELIKVKDEQSKLQKIAVERENKRKDAISNVEIKIKEVETKNSQIQLQVDKLKSAKTTCPTCGQEIGKEKNLEMIKVSEMEIKKNDLELIDLNQTLKKYQEVILPEYKQIQEKEQFVKNLEEETKNYFLLITKINDLEKSSQLYTKLQQAETGVKTQLEAISDLKKIYLAKIEESKKAQDFDEKLVEGSKKLDEIEQKLKIQIVNKEAVSQKLNELLGKVGEAKQLISRVEQMENLFQQKQEEKSTFTKEKGIYEELSLAFGKKGIQAMIIENAIPEIEDEANKLLNRLTEGRMKVSFETQKETKTKVQTLEGKAHATVETLDIIISDEMGERPYEMYSGGETFRVNFAIRLAISKLLAHRAGAKLQFLVIDEGFGTQDAAGRTRLVEVLDTIKNDFEKIVIITHLEELKEEFPTRIEVSKGVSGSTFEVVGN